MVGAVTKVTGVADMTREKDRILGLKDKGKERPKARTGSKQRTRLMIISKAAAKWCKLKSVYCWFTMEEVHPATQKRMKKRMSSTGGGARMTVLLRLTDDDVPDQSSGHGLIFTLEGESRNRLSR